MKNFILSLFLLCGISLASAQDSTYYQFTNGIHSISTVTTNGDKSITETYTFEDSIAAVRFVVNTVVRQQDRFYRGKQLAMYSKAETNYALANTIVKNITSDSLNLVEAVRQPLAGTFSGVWILTYGANTLYFQFDQDGTVTQIDINQDPVVGGITGTWRALSSFVFEVVAPGEVIHLVDFIQNPDKPIRFNNEAKTALFRKYQ